MKPPAAPTPTSDKTMAERTVENVPQNPGEAVSIAQNKEFISNMLSHTHSIWRDCVPQS